MGVTRVGIEPTTHGLKVRGSTTELPGHPNCNKGKSGVLGEITGKLDETRAEALVARAVDQLGGGRTIVGSPRHPFSMHATDSVDVDGHTVTVHYGEMSSPAIATVEGWVFEITLSGLVLLDAPRERRKPE